MLKTVLHCLRWHPYRRCQHYLVPSGAPASFDTQPRDDYTMLTTLQVIGAAFTEAEQCWLTANLGKLEGFFATDAGKDLLKILLTQLQAHVGKPPDR